MFPQDLLNDIPNPKMYEIPGVLMDTDSIPYLINDVIESKEDKIFLKSPVRQPHDIMIIQFESYHESTTIGK
ncbi:hypothetical protein TRFO_17004 [Tritrichomonas foetus]|uniref:Uncharacterized protein n=1 Tax=Tritrichomonas foetus TaxID=1144522 RepID=A0A1J4KTY9_9EUKA|nr:hypothetical protein TRFO_17004 [Tritrichomonas foetus]|eukprot:OHT12949.1 hypothetical protein TRFO_17004 [Tritrichomonas foetus]